MDVIFLDTQMALWPKEETCFESLYADDRMTR